jgi:hypothetical protein
MVPLVSGLECNHNNEGPIQHRRNDAELPGEKNRGARRQNEEQNLAPIAGGVNAVTRVAALQSRQEEVERIVGAARQSQLLISPGDLTAYQNARRDRGKAPKTFDNELSPSAKS